MRRTESKAAWCEALEPRVLLSHLPVEVYYPEGFAHDNVTEMVSVHNPGAVAATFELWARYEVGERDQLLASGVLGPQEQTEIMLAEAGEPGSRLVRKSTPFALELESDQPLTASLRHDDFGGQTSQTFTDVTDDQWTFARVVKGGDSRDFIVFYNPGDDAVEIEVELFDDSGPVMTLTQVVEGQRRGGWNLHREAAVPMGTYAVHARADAPVVVGVSHYEPEAGTAAGFLGQTGLGARAGAILAVEFEDRVNPGADDGGDDDTVVSVFNGNEMTASVTLHWLNRGDDSAAAGPPPTAVEVAPGTRVDVSLRAIGPADLDEITLVYTSDVEVSVQASTVRQGTLFATPAIDIAATSWTFATGQLDRVEDDELRTEDIFVFNPGAASVEVTVTFIFADGQVVVEAKSLDRLEGEDVDARLEDEAFPGGPLDFAVIVTSTGPIVASFEHWDREVTGEGFTIIGDSGGTVVPLVEVLDL